MIRLIIIGLLLLSTCSALSFLFHALARRRSAWSVWLATFDTRWPAIDDDEFVRRCKPGTPRDTALGVRRIVSEQLGVPYEQIYPEQSFVNDLGCD